MECVGIRPAAPKRWLWTTNHYAECSKDGPILPLGGYESYTRGRLQDAAALDGFGGRGR